ncbi:hypothetical protein RUM44_008955 [Polyplax serrata]|uniref:Uncharacterized protein n=1 Tax=Polyplax serrata TaxID=468196 RepID=A0ABR1ARC1_POLSC
MPRKKVHNGSIKKQANKETRGNKASEPIVEEKEEEYLTVVDHENRKKYEKRPIENNWAKYDAPPSSPPSDHELDEETDVKTNDFGYLLKNASSDYSHFEFSSEKLWKKEERNVPSCSLFNLDLNLLSNGLACVPFYDRIEMDVKDLTLEEKSYFDVEAEKNWSVYNPIREHFLQKSQARNTSINKKKYFELNESNVDKCDDNTGKSKRNLLKSVHDTQEQEKISGSFFHLNTDKCGNLAGNVEKHFHEGGSAKKIEETSPAVFSEKENLEDWLDSVLDD